MAAMVGASIRTLPASSRQASESVCRPGESASDGRLYVRVGRLLRWVNVQFRLRLTDCAIRRRLGLLGHATSSRPWPATS